MTSATRRRASGLRNPQESRGTRMRARVRPQTRTTCSGSENRNAHEAPQFRFVGTQVKGLDLPEADVERDSEESERREKERSERGRMDLCETLFLMPGDLQQCLARTL